MLRICFVINAIIPIIYVIIYWADVKKRTKGEEISVASKRLLSIGVTISIIALLASIILNYFS